MSETSNSDKSIALIVRIILDIINESSDSSDTNDSDDEILLRELNRRSPVPRIKCKNYVENIVSLYSDMEFKSHFR